MPGQPFTFGGVARYASARPRRLVGVALLFALVAAAVIFRFAAHCWWPVLGEAIERLPERARLEGGMLQVRERDAGLLAANEFLSLQITIGERSGENAPVDLAVQLGRYELTVTSLFGESSFPYPERLKWKLDRDVVWPFWGAWKGPIRAGLAGVAVLFLLAAWFGMALVYAPFALFVGGIAGREITFVRAWKLSVAAQWPASLLMSFAIALYSTGEIGLLFVIIMFGAHFLSSLLNVLIAPFFLPKATLEKGREKKKVRGEGKKIKKSNPFGSEKARKGSKRNPFNTAE